MTEYPWGNLIHDAGLAAPTMMAVEGRRQIAAGGGIRPKPRGRRPRGHRLRAVPNKASGPGVIAPDGCAVDVYSVLPPHNEVDLVGVAVPVGSTVLELGAGAGRVTGPLIAAGYDVTAVDESQDMLDRFDDAGAEQVAASIQWLNLGRTFGCVLLMSHLLNTHEDSLRHEFLRCCARHVADDGVVIVQRHPPSWFERVAESDGEDGEVVIRLRQVSRPTLHTVTATAEYEHLGRVWTHTFSARCLRDEDVADELAAAGLVFGRWLDGERAWFTAHPRTSFGTVPFLSGP